jgi:hypothetical protein
MKDTIDMAREAGYMRTVQGGAEVSMASMDCLKAFEALVRADERSVEREACAKFIETEYVRQFKNPWRDDLSAAIRARGNT